MHGTYGDVAHGTSGIADIGLMRSAPAAWPALQTIDNIFLGVDAMRRRSHVENRNGEPYVSGWSATSNWKR